MKIRSTNLLTISTYMFFVMAYIEDTIPYGQVLTLLSLVLMIYSCQESKGFSFSIPLNSGFIGYLTVFFLFCVASMTWAESASRTFIIVRHMFMILIQMTIVYSCHYQRSTVDSLLKIVMNGGYIVIFYAVLRYGWSSLMSALSQDIRISNDVINANSLGMCAAFSIVINVYYIFSERLRLHDILIVPSLIIIAASGSRKSIIIVVVGVLMVVVFKNFQKKHFVNNMLKGIAGVAAVVGLMFALSKLPVFDILRRRMTGFWTVLNGTAVRGTAGYIRMVYNQIGLELFKQHPILGIGLHNANRYISQYYGHPHLHNNFIELLACGGIVGFLIHYSFYFYLFIEMWKIRNNRNKEYDICLILLIIRFVMGYGYIQYSALITYFNLLIFYMCIKTMKNERKEATYDYGEGPF